MDFDRVFSCLVDLFPEIDPHLLEAIATENDNDVDVAVEVVLTNICPAYPTTSVTEISSDVGVTNGEKSNQSSRELLGDNFTTNVKLKSVVHEDVQVEHVKCPDLYIEHTGETSSSSSSAKKEI